MPATSTGYDYFYWYDRKDGNVLGNQLLSFTDTLTATEELFPQLSKDSHNFLGWYYRSDVGKKIYIKIGDTIELANNSYHRAFYGDWEKLPNKIVYKNRTLIDISNDTVKENVLIEGYTAHDKMGWIIKGTMPNNGAMNKTMDGISTKSISVPSGYTSGGTVKLDDTIDNAVANAITELLKKGVEVPSETNVADLANLIASVNTEKGTAPFTKIITGSENFTTETSSFALPETENFLSAFFIRTDSWNKKEELRDDQIQLLYVHNSIPFGFANTYETKTGLCLTYSERGLYLRYDTSPNITEGQITSSSNFIGTYYYILIYGISPNS